MALSQRQKQLIVEALLRSASDAGIDERNHRMQLAAMLLRSAAEQRAEAARVVTELRGKYADSLAGLDASIELQRTQLTSAIAELDEILAQLGS